MTETMYVSADFYCNCSEESLRELLVALRVEN